MHSVTDPYIFHNLYIMILIISYTTDFNENVTVTADTDVFLECMIDDPTFLDWQKDDKAIEVSNAYRERRVYIIRGEGLLVLNAEYNDRGHYMCLGIRNTYMIQKTISLDVAPSSDEEQPLHSCESWFVPVILIVIHFFVLF